ncbi:hypothetical protein U1Q18_014707, partial [Sarracenia purpurea var. burkii]
DDNPQPVSTTSSFFVNLRSIDIKTKKNISSNLALDLEQHSIGDLELQKKEIDDQFESVIGFSSPESFLWLNGKEERTSNISSESSSTTTTPLGFSSAESGRKSKCSHKKVSMKQGKEKLLEDIEKLSQTRDVLKMGRQPLLPVGDHFGWTE